MAKEIVSLSSILGNSDEAKAIVAQDNLQKSDKDWKKDELAKLKAEKDKHLGTIDAACKTAKEGVTDNLQREEINIKFNLQKVKVKKHYASLMEPFEIDAEVVGEAGGAAVGEKVGAFIAPGVKAVVQTANGIFTRSGLSELFKFKK